MVLEAKSTSETPIDRQAVKEQRMKEILDPAGAALVVVDMQNDFVADDGKSAKNWNQNVAPMQAIIPKIHEMESLFYKMGRPVIRTINFEDVANRNLAGRNRALFMEEVIEEGDEEFGVACLRGSYGAALAWPAKEEDIIIEKTTSSFVTEEFKQQIKKNGIKTVMIAGVKTPRCILGSVFDLFNDPEVDLNVVILEDCIASDDVEQHERTLEEMRRFYPPVITSFYLKEAWKDALNNASDSISSGITH